ncbi:dipeptidase [uncultured Friedmanniella sp.]|uniref:dipeptidase n=1 Tax=uncultured Friedmanniella sp. TaxID=335381 RepID=UPI0035CA44C5
MTLAETVRAQQPAVLADLARLVAIPSVSDDPARADQVEASAALAAGLLTELGCPDVQVVRAAGGKPAVIARYPAPAGQPTVCLYAHHDVQPEGDLALWSSPPFEATQRGARLFGRGTADDKGGLAVHLAALRAFDGQPPVGVTVFLEGEEEMGSPTLAALLDAHREQLAADVFVIADSANWAVGQPAFTTSLRGIGECYVELRTLDHAVHSGAYGGVAPDALTTLCRLLATLHDEHGDVAVAGLSTSPPPELEYPEDRLRAESGLLDGVQQIGTGTVVERLWCKPAVAVIALDATPVARASNTLVPVARAKLSLRVAPGDDARAATAKLAAHLHEHVPYGAHLTVTPGDSGEPSTISFAGPYAEVARTAFADAWGVPPVFVGQGGSIPMVADFGAAFPEATVLVTAVGDPDTRAHGTDESLHLGDFQAACVAETLMLQGFADLQS